MPTNTRLYAVFALRRGGFVCVCVFTFSQEEPHTEKNTHSSSEWSLTDRRLDVDIDDKRVSTATD